MSEPLTSESRAARFPTVARKRFGQHFLVDEQVIGEILRFLSAQPSDAVVEIGPGRGALTKYLASSGARVEAIEIDRNLIDALRASFIPGTVTIHEADALKFDYSALALRIGKLRIIGNLPYNISTPLLLKLVQIRQDVVDMCLMLQKEVAERLTGQPRTPDYGRLSVMVQAYMEVDQILDVGPTAFQPPPRVNSSVVRLRPRAESNDDVPFATLSSLVAIAFSHRRKMLRHTLGKIIPQTVLHSLHIDLSQRPEEITVAQYVALARVLMQGARNLSS